MPCRRMLDELNALHTDFRALSVRVEGAVAELARALQEPDGEVSADGDEPVSEQVRRVVERCRGILLLYQPVAVDFRRVTAILRAATELERIGDLAAEITGRTAELSASRFPVLRGLSELAASVCGMIHRALDADGSHHPEPVEPMVRARAEATARASALTEQLAATMKVDPEAVEPGLTLFAVVRDLQRIADHAAGLVGAEGQRPISRLSR